MNITKRKIVLLVFLFFLMPFLALAAETSVPENGFFKAEVIKIVEQKKTVLPDGTKTEQQNLLLRGLEGDFLDKEIVFDGIKEFDLINKNIYQVGDRVLVVASFDDVGEVAYYITDYVRTKSLWLLVIVFIAVLLIVGRVRGLRALIALFLTFLVIIKYIIPKFLIGANPLSITLIGSFIILLIIIYVTEGFSSKSHISIVSIFFSLVITILLSNFFVGLAKLTGVTSEEVSFLLHIGDQAIDFRGLLLAGIIIGALGVLDDVVISQVTTVEQIIKINVNLKKIEVFKSAYKVGVSHIASMTNTLFLAYVGVSLPLLILLVSGESAFSSFGQIINNEAIATEIVRTLAGSIGLILSVPIATFVAVWWYKRGE